MPVLTLMADWGVKLQRRKSGLGTRAIEDQTSQQQDDSQIEESA
jgi:hypothetical protein